MHPSTISRYNAAIVRLTVIEAGIDYKVLFSGYCPVKGAKQLNKVQSAKYALIDLLQQPLCI